jgi:hypothetical protein
LESGANGGGSARPDAEAFELFIGKIRDVVEAQVPGESPFVVVSKGDAALGRIAADRVRHFPQDDQGAPTDVPPADGADAVAQVERLRAGGVEYLVFPSSSFGWLERFPELNDHLMTRHQLLASEDACLVYRLVEQPPPAVAEAPPAPDPSVMAAISGLLDQLAPPRSSIAVLTLAAGTPVPAGMQSWTFPRAARADLRLAAGQISALEDGGIEFLVIPAPEREWLELHPELLSYLRSRHRLVTSQGHLCDVYELEAPRAAGEGELSDAAAPPQRSAEGGGSPVTRLVGTVLRTSVDGLIR